MRAIALALGLLAFGQPSFKSGVELVRIPVSVTRSGDFVAEGLTAADFTLKEDGVTQSIAVLERDATPVSVCIALDASGSMTESATLAVMAINQLGAALAPSDELALMAFADSSSVLIPWSAPDAAAQLKIVAEIGGSTSLHDATRSALDLLASARHSRRVVLLITDGIDNSSRSRLVDIVTTRRESEAIIYAFTVAPNRAQTRVEQGGISGEPNPATMSFARAAPPTGGISSVTALVGDSGGATYTMANTADVKRIARNFVDDLRNQFTIGYTPAKAFDGKYRRVKVEINKRGYRVRHRSGYLALPSGDKP